MEIKVFVEIPALDHLAEVLRGTIANRKEVQTHTETSSTSAAAPASALEPAAVTPTPEPASAAPVSDPAPEAAVVTPAPVQTTTAPTAPVSPGTAPTYTRDELAKAAADHLMPQRMKELTSLLASFGVQSLMDLPEARFGEFATALRGLGAKI